MKLTLRFFAMIILFAACKVKSSSEAITAPALPIEGTWKLLSGTLIEKGDTTVTEYTKNISFIKIINKDHFAFLSHDVNAPDMFFQLTNGQFAIFFPEDVHAPMIGEGNIKKMVIKVAI